MDWTQFWAVGGFWIGAAGGLVGIVGLFITLKTLHRDFRYYVISFPVVKDYKSTLDELSVLYQGKEVERLTVSRLAFWNAGWNSIGQEDISKILPVRLAVVEEGIILDAKVVYTTSEANGVRVERNVGGDYLILFDNLDPGMGSVLQIIHTGLNSRDMRLDGKIRGVKTLKRNNVRESYKDRTLSYLSIIFFIMIPISFISFLLFPSTQSNPNTLITFLLTYFGIALVIGIIVFFRNPSPPNNLINEMAGISQTKDVRLVIRSLLSRFRI